MPTNTWLYEVAICSEHGEFDLDTRYCPECGASLVTAMVWADLNYVRRPAAPYSEGENTDAN